MESLPSSHPWRQRLAHWRQQVALRCDGVWRQLTIAQRCYLLSVFMLLCALAGGDEDGFSVALLGICLIGAVVAEIWQGFVRLWHTLPGKGLILIFYAVLANFCFAFADSYVNDLIGVKADIVPYSTNLAVMLLAPLWGFLLAFVVLTLYLLVHVLKLTAVFLLRPFGIRSHQVLAGSYPLATLLAQLICIPLTYVYLTAAVLGYATGDTVNINLHGEEQTVSSQQSGVQPAPPVASSNEAALARLFGNSTNNGQAMELAPKIGWLYRTVAHFIYHVESLGKSQCQQQGVEHLVHVNDFEVLVITPDATATYGYDFHVRSCASATMPAILGGRLYPANTER